MKNAIVFGFLASVLSMPILAQQTGWRQATTAELTSVLPSRAQVLNEHIETEMRTASGIVNDRGEYIAGVVLLTAGYSADGKYSHFLLLQAPMHVDGLALAPGDYLIGWTRSTAEDMLNVHFNVAATGKLVGNAKARKIPGRGRVESIFISPPQSGGMIQIGRFGIPYTLGKTSAEK